MKLANLTAKVRGIKVNAVKVLAAATLAGGLLVAATPAAQAQRFYVGFGRPRVYVAPPVYGPAFYGPRYYGYRHDDWRWRHDGYRRGWR